MVKHLIISALCLFVVPMYSFEKPYFTVGAGAVFPVKDSSSKADSTSSLFLGTFPGSSLFILPNVDWKNKYSTGYELYALAGTSFLCYYRCDVEFLYQCLKREVSGHYDWREIDATTNTIFAENSNNPIHHAVSNAHLLVALTNFYYDIKTYNFINFYLGGGFGTAWLHSSSTIASNTLNIGPPIPSSPTVESSPVLGGTAFAWQLKIGTACCLVRHLFLGINYRLLGTTQFQARESKIISNPNTPDQVIFKIPQRSILGLINNSVNISLTYLY